jgi:hypothetical protein
MKFLLDWHPAVSIILLCSASVFVSYLGLKLVRKRFSDDVLRENHEVGGFIFNAFGLIYAVLIAFVVFVTWTEFDGSKKNTDLEASELADLFNNSKAFPDSLQKQIQSAIAEYTKSVINDEWPLLEKGGVSEKTQKTYHRLWDTYTTMDTKKIPNLPVYQESLKHLNDLGEKRRNRIFDSRDDIPGIIWAVLLFGGVMTVIYTYFFCTRKIAAQFLMTSGLAVINTVILYMIFSLDNPFVGYTKIDPAAFDYVLGLIKGTM